MKTFQVSSAGKNGNEPERNRKVSEYSALFFASVSSGLRGEKKKSDETRLNRFAGRPAGAPVDKWAG
ncbi:hypothetical protein [Falsirhodobacter halotolerans]|uniref:hypothetical protein n=1 Tax=Falsirhodobacter halotolerans TaxID=1146892 RepID=UPI001FD53400|nr:hypothetical protein [Falsirhodobacter halotolerans]MCJ8139370.1 hypothetical protein [Falsirhodobacter halotolerans]